MRITPIGFVNYSSGINNKRQSVKNEVYVKSPIKQDYVSFSSLRQGKKMIGVSVDIAKKLANSLSTSTSGHRAPWLSETFNKDTVSLITLGIAGVVNKACKNDDKIPTVLIGGDAREATKKSLPVIENTLLEQGVNVIYIKDPVPTPLLAMHAKNKQVDLAVLMTASHNSWKDGGYNMVTKDAAIATEDVTQEVAKNIMNFTQSGFYKVSGVKAKSVSEYPYEEYKKMLVDSKLIDFENIKQSNMKIYYDGLQGAGPYVVPRLLKDFNIPFEEVKSSGQEGPNPISNNLVKLKEKVASASDSVKLGLANDGDADRFGVVDEKGTFVDANDVILLTTYHLAKNKGLKGTVIKNQGTSMQVDVLANKIGLDVLETPIGFKFIGEEILNLRKQGKDIVVAGEESGGLTVQGHIPEKDGIMAIMLIADLVATEKKPLSKILKDIKSGLGKSLTLHAHSQKMTDDKAKDVIMARFKEVYNRAVAGRNKFGEHEIDVGRTIQHQKRMESFKKGGDGVKLILTDGSTVLVRKSGTEPLIKYYIEATGKNDEDSYSNKNSIKTTVEKLFNK